MTWVSDSSGRARAPGAAKAPLGGRAGARHAWRAALALALVAGIATPALAARVVKAPKQRFSFDTALSSFQPPATDPANFRFTAPGAPPSRLQTAERAFRFTPSGQADRKALALGVTSRVVAAAADRSRAAAPVDALAASPIAYNVDVSLAWKGFAVNTGFTRTDPGPLALAAGRRDAIDLGVSYRGRNWRTSLQGTAEQGGLILYAPLERRYSVELGGAYLVAPRLSVTGGVRYRLAPEAPSLLDVDRADQSVYFGTNFAF